MIQEVHFILALFLSCSCIAQTTTISAPNGTCYAPDGSAVNEDGNMPYIAPCIDIAGVHSMCCKLNTTDGPDTCQTNGLCLEANGNVFYRDYCTDPTWSTPNCLPKTICEDDPFAAMTHCEDGSWCCGTPNVTCCDQGLGFKLADNLIEFSSPNGTCTSPTITVTAAAVTATVTAQNGKGVGTRVLTGVAVGLAALVVFGSLAGFFTGLRRGKALAEKMNDVPMYGTIDTKAPMIGHNGEIHETEGVPLAELGEEMPRRDLK